MSAPRRRDSFTFLAVDWPVVRSISHKQSDIIWKCSRHAEGRIQSDFEPGSVIPNWLLNLVVSRLSNSSRNAKTKEVGPAQTVVAFRRLGALNWAGVRFALQFDNRDRRPVGGRNSLLEMGLHRTQSRKRRFCRKCDVSGIGVDVAESQHARCGNSTGAADQRRYRCGTGCCFDRTLPIIWGTVSQLSRLFLRLIRKGDRENVHPVDRKGCWRN